MKEQYKYPNPRGGNYLIHEDRVNPICGKRPFFTGKRRDEWNICFKNWIESQDFYKQALKEANAFNSLQIQAAMDPNSDRPPGRAIINQVPYPTNTPIALPESLNVQNDSFLQKYRIPIIISIAAIGGYFIYKQIKLNK